MPRLHRRTRVISIRLSDEEFDQLQSLCSARGADSISELARAAMKLLIVEETTNGKAAIEARVTEMNTRVGVLDREVARISTMMGLARLNEANAEAKAAGDTQ